MTWEPGVPLYSDPRPNAHVREMFEVLDDRHDVGVTGYGDCVVCDDPKLVADPGIVWSKLLKAVPR